MNLTWIVSEFCPHSQSAANQDHQGLNFVLNQTTVPQTFTTVSVVLYKYAPSLTAQQSYGDDGIPFLVFCGCIWFIFFHRADCSIGLCNVRNTLHSFSAQYSYYTFSRVCNGFAQLGARGASIMFSSGDE